jgi:hypothetical protein
MIPSCGTHTLAFSFCNVLRPLRFSPLFHPERVIWNLNVLNVFPSVNARNSIASDWPIARIQQQ